MPDQSTILSLPYILPSQAQKHVTHNEALRRLDVAVQLAVYNRTRSAPPALPAVGDRHIVAASATGDWAGRVGDVALFSDEGWEFYTPLPGWRAHVLDEAVTVVFDGSDWAAPGAGALNPSKLGVNTTANNTNRLAVAADATLLTHDGNGHQLKVNKAATSDTASLLFQSGFSGRAEMGLAGNNDFSVKVSPDGSTFQTALAADADSGVVRLPQGIQIGGGTEALPGIGFIGDLNTGIFRLAPNRIGLSCGGATKAALNALEFQIDVPVTGAAAQSSALDATEGRLMKVGAFGLGGDAVDVSDTAALDTVMPNLRLRVQSANVATVNGPAGAAGGVVDSYSYGSGYGVQIYLEISGSRRMFQRSYNGGWNDWVQIMDQRNVLGVVSQVAGLPTGAIVETGSNSNGSYTRWADGTQLCSLSFNRTLSISSGHMGGFRSSGTTWTYPAAFSQNPVVTASVQSLSAVSAIVSASTTSAATIVVTAVTSQASASRDFAAIATGRWF